MSFTLPRCANISTEILSMLVDHSPDALLIVGSDGKVSFANGTCAELLGYQPFELIGQSPEILVPPEQREMHRANRELFKTTPSRRGMGRLNTLVAIKKDGTPLPVDIALNPIGQDSNGPLIAVAIRDASAQRAFMNNLERLATTDALTGALNRRSLESAYMREVERCRRQNLKLFVMMLDIDHFKDVNDRHGHAAGDTALKELVRCCLKTLRKTDVLARIGGEEFAVLTPAADIFEARLLAERLREHAAQLIICAGPETFAFTVSIGLADVDMKDPDLDAVLQRADRALYTAKMKGRNRVEDFA